jgi:hypothetical protein
MVTITGMRQGKCLLSGKQGDVVDVEFKDGTLKGPLSFKSLEKLLKARAEDARQATLPSVPQNPISPM